MMVLDKWASCSLFIGLLAQDCQRQQQIENNREIVPVLILLPGKTYTPTFNFFYVRCDKTLKDSIIDELRPTTHTLI